MPYFYVNPEEINGPVFNLTGEEAAHLRRVLRSRIGDRIFLFDGLGNFWHAEISAMSKESVSGKILESRRQPKLPCSIVLCFSMPSRKAFDDILERGTAAGISQFQPLITSRSQETKTDWSGRSPRMRQILISSCKQCERALLPEIKSPLPFGEALKHFQSSAVNGAHGFIASFEGIPVSAAVSAAAAGSLNDSKIFLFIGPEGGFTAEEISQAGKAGLISISLGPYVLRAEEACFYASLALINAIGGAFRKN